MTSLLLLGYTWPSSYVTDFNKPQLKRKRISLKQSLIERRNNKSYCEHGGEIQVLIVSMYPTQDSSLLHSWVTSIACNIPNIPKRSVVTRWSVNPRLLHSEECCISLTNVRSCSHSHTHTSTCVSTHNLKLIFFTIIE